MRQRIGIVALVGVFVVAAAIAQFGCDRGPNDKNEAAADKSDRPVLAVTVFPLADLAARVAGQRWQVVTLLPPGRSPHGYSLRPAEARGLMQARLLVMVGGGLDNWARSAAASINSDCPVLVLADDLKPEGGQASPVAEPHMPPATGPAASAALVDAAATHLGCPADSHDADEAAVGAGEDDHEHHEHHGHCGHCEHHEHHDHDGVDPHFWLDPVLAGRIAGLVAAKLAELDPAGREDYERNLAAVRSDLQALDTEYRTGLRDCRARTLVVFHAGYGHLARRYDLEQVAILSGMTASPAHVEQVAGMIRERGILAVYREPQMQSRWIDFIAERSGAKVLVLDPLGSPGQEGYGTYMAMMRSNLQALREGLACDD